MMLMCAAQQKRLLYEEHMYLHLFVTGITQVSFRQTHHFSRLRIQDSRRGGHQKHAGGVGVYLRRRSFEKNLEEKKRAHVCAGIRKRLAALGSSVRTALSARSRCKKKR